MSTGIEEGRNRDEVNETEDDGINLELRPEYQRSRQRRLKAALALSIGCILVATALILRYGSGSRFFHELFRLKNNNRNDGGSDFDDDIFSQSKDWIVDDAFDDEFDDYMNIQKVVPTKQHPPPTRWPTPSPTTFSPTQKPVPIPYVNICTPPIPSSIEGGDDGGGSFAVLDHVDLLQESDNCNAVLYDCKGAISALVIGGAGEIVIAGFSAHSRPRTSASVGEKAGWYVGLVRVFAYSCDYNSYRQLGPDLSPLNPEAVGDLFGSSVVATHDGKVLAIGAKVDNRLDWARAEEETLKPYVGIYHLVDDGISQRWEQRGERITGQWQAPAKGSDEKGVAGIALNEDGSMIALFDKDDATKSCGNEGTNCRINVFQYGESPNGEDGSLRKTTNAKKGWLMLGNPIPFPTWPEQWKSGPGGSLPLLELAGNISDNSQLILTLRNPYIGTIRFRFNSEPTQWEQVDKLEVQKFPPYFDGAMYSSFDTLASSRDGAIMSITSEVGEPDGPDGTPRGGAQHAAVIVDLSAASEDKVVYSRSYIDWLVKIDTEVSRDGNVVAVLPSTASLRNLEVWTTWPEIRRIGELQIFVRKHSCRSGESDDGRVLEESTLPWSQQFAEKWSKGVDADNTCWFTFESIKLSGQHWAAQSKLYAWLSDDGKIAAVGNTFNISMYHIHVPSEMSGDENDLNDMNVSSGPSEISSKDEEPNTNPQQLTAEDICPPFPNVTDAMHAGDLILDLPGINRQTLSVASSNDASIIAVGISYLDSEKGGMVRVYAWSCKHLQFVQLGQDLHGKVDYDGFGISVDISFDGMIVCVGAYQPLPSTSGYVEVYKYNTIDWKWSLVGQRIKVASQHGYRIGVGQHVKMSDDGTVVAFSGVTSAYGASYFIGVVALQNDQWERIGNSLIESEGTHDREVHLSLSGDGKTLVSVVGSVSYQMWDSFARVYDINLIENSWSEYTIPKPSRDYKEFRGYGVSINREGTTITVAGTTNTSLSRGIFIKYAEKSATGEWVVKKGTITPSDRKEAYSIGAVSSFDAKGTTFAVGVNGYSEEPDDLGWAKGSIYLSSTAKISDHTTTSWDSFRMVKGEERLDQLGSTLYLSQDGSFVIAGSRAGYLRFFRMT